MLAGLLNHTPWGGAFETHFIPKQYRRYQRAGRRHGSTSLHRVVEAVLAERPIKKYLYGIDVREFCDALERHDFGTIVDQICLRIAARNGLASWADKTPHYILEIDLLHRIFPNSKWLYIVRDGRDVSLSLIRKRWGPANVYSCALLWKACNQPQATIERLKCDRMLLELRYEDLLEAPRAKLGEVLAFLEVDPEAARAEEMAATVNRANHGTWRSRMSAGQVRVFEFVAGGTLRRFGYGATHQEQPVGVLASTYFTAADRVKHARRLFGLNVIDTIRIRFFGQNPFPGEG